MTLLKPGVLRKARRIAGSKKHHERVQERKRKIARERNARKRSLATAAPCGLDHWDLDYAV
ncbi:MAG TPA: hypothetical protein VIG24_13010 [Acidimicrobiia bacterium]